ncbi:MAG: TonB-dependent receptor, partial [Flavitalea sp.]
QQLTAQSIIKGRTTDAQTIEPIRDTSILSQVVVTANRGQSAKRSETPVAISALNQRQIQDAKAISIDQLLNKVSGVNMVDLGNEQHQMSIRQPMTTRSLFLYLEDGIPVRTTGLFNHNALLEMNMAATKTIEVIKGPSSSLYGSEAIGGVVNFISLVPTAVPLMRISAVANNLGYKRTDLQSGFMKGKFGMVVNGYIAKKDSRVMEYNDFSKKAISIRADYRFTDQTTLTNNVSYINYKSDMAGGIDSAMFATRSFTNPQTFTFRNVESFRYNSTLKHLWNKQSNSTATLVYRNNTIAQNPAYRIKDDYKKVNGVWRGDKTLAHGEINASRFQSVAFIAQHRQALNWKKAEIIAGASVDLSPSTYDANYIRIKKDTVSKKYTQYSQPDSLLTNYKTGINNFATFVNFSFSPVEKLHIVASVRHDLFTYKFNNKLQPSAFSGSPDTINHFSRVSPKIGLTYNFHSGVGLYINYSEGFIPPQVSEMFTGVKVPYLSPSVFYNYELGGWMEIIRNKLSADFSLYRLNGTDEIISVRLNDGSTENQNAGKTLHEGIEFGLNVIPVKEVQFRFSGAYSKHKFIEHSEKGVQMNGNTMPNAPELVFNSEIWYKPAFIPGFRLGAEIQKVGKYFTDPQNTATYDGYTILNLRAGYKKKAVEIWLNVMNVTDEYYSNITTKSSFGWSYRLGDPRNFNLGLACDLYSIFNKK